MGLPLMEITKFPDSPAKKSATLCVENCSFLKLFLFQLFDKISDFHVYFQVLAAAKPPYFQDA